MKEALRNINLLVEKNIITKYAIGGAFASIFYTEPIATYDLDIMIILTEEINTLNPLQRIYEWARENHFAIDKEHIIISGIPIQFLPAYNELVKKATENSNEFDYEGIKVYVIKPEYLIAMMLDVYRSKDKERALRFLKQAKPDKNLLSKIILKYNLSDKFNSIQLKND